MKPKKIVLGIGSQRAGSTLLYKILNLHSDVYMHPVKELHYFDTLFGIRDPKVLKDFSRNNILRINRDIYESNSGYNHSKRFRCELRTYNILYEKNIKKINYFDLFRPCLLENDVIGEITPEYMLLSEEEIKHVKDTLGSQVIIILITRNPLDRFASSVKLLNAYGKESKEKLDINHAIKECMDSMPSWIEQQARLSDYAGTLIRFRKYFSKVICLSYERLVENPEAELMKLKKFIPTLDVMAAKHALNERVNSLGESNKLNEESKSLIAAAYEKYNISCEVEFYD